jgi:RHS repeat-associated protein
LFQREEEIRQSATLGALYYSEASKTENVNKYISFAYDNAGRRASLTVPGQSVVNYTFNNANRMTQIAQGTATVGFTYDNANRRATLTLPNGVVTSYNYDTASQLTGITYTLGSNPLGTLSYAYDNDGRRSSVTGSFARTGLPLAMSQTAYNANNQLTTWGTANLFYDLNGNMTSDGTHSYTWDARNRLTQIDSGNTANFAYDPFGRRTSKTILSAQTGFLYDGANAVQELSGTTVTANSLSGGIDEVFQRTDSAGARSFLTDALGSTTALVDSTGTVQTSYTFEPFGNTATTGSATTNSFAYTGRELDAGNLYYYRARYYSPTIERFISEDPIGFNGGDAHLYAYVGGSPTNFRDSAGMNRDCFTTACGGLPRVSPPPPPPLPTAGRKPKEAAADYCRDNGQLSFNIPFTNIPVTVGASTTLGPANFSSTNDINTVFPLFPWPEWLAAGASVDITINAPSEPSINPSAGLGKNLSLGYFTTPNGPQGVSLSLGPSIGPPVNISVPTNNLCGMVN